MVTIHDLEQGTPEWLDIRKDKFTGSNAYKLLSSFGASEWAKTRESGFKGNYWTKRGSLLEHEAIELYETICNIKVDRPGFVTNNKYPDCGYSPDGMVDDLIIEVKCFDEPQHMQLVNVKTEDDIPLKIRAQVQYGLMVCERKAAILIAYNPRISDPKKAFRMIPIKASRNIHNNFRRILSNEKVMV